MSKDRKKLLHIHSSVNDKQPTPATLELGELGVNNAEGNAFISTKNSNGEIVRFSEDETVIKWMEQKEVFPYEAYVRGADETQVSGVTESDKLNNKSNIIIKLNQVVPENTDYSPYDEKVNGAKDIYDNIINPMGGGGYKDGAGLAIDMSLYAMQGANPSFSSVTTTCHATLQGTTEIKGGGSDCGSKFKVNVGDVCIESTDKLNLYGINESNIGIGCDGESITRQANVKGGHVQIEAPSHERSITLKGCSKIENDTDYFEVKECADNNGSFIAKMSKVDVSACTHNYTNTNDFKVIECSDGDGKVLIDTTKTDINSCDKVSANTNNFTITECTDGSGKVGIDTTNINVSANTTNIKSCDEIKLESKNLILTDGECGNGEITIETNDLCIVGNAKVNVYGDETNLGLDCDCSEGANIATKTRMFGKGIAITTDENCDKAVSNGSVNINAVQNVNASGNNIFIEAVETIGKTSKNITENASNDIVETANRNIDNVATNGNITETANNGSIIETADNISGISTTDIYEAAGNDIISTAVEGIIENAKNISETAANDITSEASNNINATADNKLCMKGKTAYFYGTDETHIGIGCDGNKSEKIVYERTPKSGACDIHATTIDEALDEIMERRKLHISATTESETSGDVRSGLTTVTIWQDSGDCSTQCSYSFDVDSTIVSMSAETYSPESEMLKKYTLWQYIGGAKVDIGTIDIPKDHLLRDVAVVYGNWDSTTSTWTDCTEVSTECHWYIRMEWNVWTTSASTNDAQPHNNDGVNGHPDHLFTYLPADDFVKDIDSNNTNADRGVDVYVGYNVEAGKNEVSATTKVHVLRDNGQIDVEYRRANGEHYVSSYTISCVSGDVKNNGDSTNWKFDSFEKELTFTAATDASHINRKSVSWIYGDVKNASGAAYDPGDGTVNTIGSGRTMEFVIPKCASDINRSTLDWKYGDVKQLTGQTRNYDPGSYCSGVSATTEIVIPKNIDDLTNYNGSCVNIEHNLCVSGNITSTGAMYSTSDARKKENIHPIELDDKKMVRNIGLKAFNFKDDEDKRKVYGVIAQEVEANGLYNLVHTDEQGMKAVDYTSFLILRISHLENLIGHLTDRVEKLEQELNKQ